MELKFGTVVERTSSNWKVTEYDYKSNDGKARRIAYALYQLDNPCQEKKYWHHTPWLCRDDACYGISTDKYTRDFEKWLSEKYPERMFVSVALIKHDDDTLAALTELKQSRSQKVTCEV